MNTCILIGYWVVAFLFSLFYGWKAVDIHSPPRTRAQDSSGSSAAAEPVYQEFSYPRAWWWHQRWLNFLGSMVGWLVLWVLGRKFGECLISSCAASFELPDAMAALVAFAGVTGFLPGLIVTSLSAIAGLAGKLAELLASWLTKLK